MGSLYENWKDFFQYFPYILFLLAIILGCWFNKSKVVFIAFILAAAYCSYISIPEVIITFLKPQEKFIIFITLALPLNLVIFSFLRERGILSFWGRLKILFILVEGWAIYYIIRFATIDILRLLEEDFFIEASAWIGWEINGKIFLFVLPGIILFTKSIITDSFIDKTFFSILIAMGIVFYRVENQEGFSVFFSATALMLIISIIKDSYAMAYIDKLTQIPSRRALEEELLKLGGQYTIAMVDIDFFKKFNDRYGHDVGDEVLMMVAACLKGGQGKAFRFGGEEFTMLFPNKSMQAVYPHLEELRKKIAQKGYTYRGKGKSKNKKANSSQRKILRVTVSMGIAEKNEKYTTPEEVRKEADKALYRAKKKGRNCVSK